MRHLPPSLRALRIAIERESNSIRGTGRRTLVKAAAFLLRLTWVGLALLLPCRAGEKAYREYQVKAAMLYYFAADSTWPTNAFRSSTAPIVIGILGEDPFGPELLMLKGKSIKGRDLVIKAKQRGDDLSDCHLLFISRSEKEHLPSILNSLKGKPILTVSENEGFLDGGGMIRWLLINGRVRFAYDNQAIENVGLKIGATLGTAGTPVKPPSSQQ